MKLSRSMWGAVLAVLLVVMPLTALVAVPAVGAADPVLYDQSSLADGGLWYSNDFVEPIYAAYDDLIADDFTVPADRVWKITQISAYGTSVPWAEPASFNVVIYNVGGVGLAGAPAPGTVVWTGTGLSYSHVFDHYDIALTGVPDLYEGSYWVSVQGNAVVGAVVTPGVSQTFAWESRSGPATNNAAVYKNPINGRSTACTDWYYRQTCQFLGGGGVSGYDQRFTLNGLDLVNDAPVNTVPGFQGPVTDDVNLTFNAGNGNAISVDDPDIQATEMFAMSVSVSKGTLTLGSTAGLVGLAGNGTATVTFQGTKADTNAALNNLVYNPNNGFYGIDTLVLSTNDQGNNGTGGAKSDTDPVSISVQAETKITGVSGTMEYGGANANLNACLSTLNGPADPADLSGYTITFKRGTTVLAMATTGAGGCANFTGTAANPGLNVGFYPSQLTAEFGGYALLLPSSGTGNLTITRRVLWVKPVDRTVVYLQANPQGNPNIDPACPAPRRYLELSPTRGSTFAPGESFANLNLAQLRFTYNRNPPTTNATEFVGKTYRITAIGAVSSNYDIRYDPGTLKVVAAP